MDDKEKNRIIHYDIDALKQDISRLDGEIKSFSDILERAKKVKDKKNMRFWTKEIKKAKRRRKQLKEYIVMIRKAKKDGN